MVCGRPHIHPYRRGRNLWQSLLWYPRLKNATPEQRNRYRIDEEGIRWAEIDEDVSFESFTYDDPEPTGLNRIFREHPEIKPTSVAARLGISQPLFSDYLREKKHLRQNAWNQSRPRFVKLEQNSLQFNFELRKHNCRKMLRSLGYATGRQKQTQREIP